MARVVTDAKLLLDDLGDPATGPDIATEAVRLAPCQRKSTISCRCSGSNLLAGPTRLRVRRASGPPSAAAANHRLTVARPTPRASAMWHCLQPCWLSSQARIRRHSRQS